MVFSSALFVLAFLAPVVVVYFVLARFRLIAAAKVWLVLASLVFYASWRIENLPLLLASIVINFWIGAYLGRSGVARERRRGVLVAAITLNLAVLGLFKYAGFFATIVDEATGVRLGVPDLLLPLGISFFTFTQIAYLVDAFRGRAREYSAINYALFVTFFPHLIAGPIIHHAEMMPQFASRWNVLPRYRNILLGICLFGIGLFKKVAIADSFSFWVNAGFGASTPLDFFGAWATALAYTFEIYFDFSGYTDMAIGAALLFNIRLPANFNSPYKALSIQDFWRRWHITLSRFLRDYLYVPLGGNRAGEFRESINLMVTFVLGGLWHGASWMFVLWGALHGVAMVVHRLWMRLGRPLPAPLAWVLTFGFVMLTWIVFRADDWRDVERIVGGMVDLGSIGSATSASLPAQGLAWSGWLGDAMMTYAPVGLVAYALPLALAVISFVIIGQRNAAQIAGKAVATRRPWTMLALFFVAFLSMFASTSTVFLYFNF